MKLKIIAGGAEGSTPRRRASDRTHLASIPPKPKGPSEVPRMMVHYWASQLDNAEHCRRANSEAMGTIVLRGIGVVVIVAFLSLLVAKL